MMMHVMSACNLIATTYPSILIVGPWITRWCDREHHYPPTYPQVWIGTVEPTKDCVCCQLTTQIRWTGTPFSYIPSL